MEVSTTQRIAPYLGAISVADIPAEEKRESGILVVAQQGYEYDRGIIVAVANDVDVLEPGMVVYWSKGDHARIGDVNIVPACRVIAYES